MKKRDIALTGILLVLVGILIGLVISMVKPDSWGNDFAEVRVTEIQRSSQPLFNREDLEMIDTRFLFQTIATEVTPSVVYIETTVQVQGRGIDEDSSENGIWDRFLPRRARTVGSGVIISADGYILTNNHVIEDAVGEGIQVTLSDKRSYPARIVGTDPSTDLAVIKINANPLSAAVIGNSDYVDVGEWVLAIGNPFRLRSTVTAGIVSALSRDVQIINDAMRIESFIQTDAAINRGNSGGALVNTSGELIGINTAIATQSGNYQGYGFAVPSNLALKVARDLIEYGEVKRGMLGVSIESVSHPIARDLNMDRIEGVLIITAPRDGAAFDAGIRQNDVILEVNGARVNEANQLQEKVAMYRPGDQVVLTIWRDGEMLTKEVSLREMELPEPEILDFDIDPVDPDELFEEQNPEDYGIEEQSFEVGFTVRALSGIHEDDEFRMMIRSVDRESEAWNRGLREDYQILEINGEQVTSLRQFEEVLFESFQSNGSVSLKTLTPNSVTAYFVLNW
jgi:serine protease Do